VVAGHGVPAGVRRVYTAADPLLVGHVEALLEGRGIRCVVRNRHLASGVGELPPIEVWPEVWVSDEDAFAAERLVAELDANPAPGAEWQCPECGERIEGQFAVCWRCGAEAPLP